MDGVRQEERGDLRGSHTPAGHSLAMQSSSQWAGSQGTEYSMLALSKTEPLSMSVLGFFLFVLFLQGVSDCKVCYLH